MGNPFFSILIPVYKNVEYLQDCLISIVNQSFFDFEIIICFQGDKNQTSPIQDKRIKSIYLEKPSLYLARVESYKQATGEYVLFVDSDDLLLGGALQRLFDIINANPNVDIIQFGYTSSNNQKSNCRFKSTMNVLTKEEYLSYFLSELGTYPIWRKCFKHNSVDFYDEDIFMGEDALLTLSFIKSAETAISLKDVLYFYRPNAKSGTSTLNPKHLDDLSIFLIHSIEFRKTCKEIENLIFSFSWSFLNNFSHNKQFDYLSLNNVNKVFAFINTIHFKTYPYLYKKCFYSAMKKKISNIDWLALKVFIKVFGIRNIKIRISNKYKH